MVFGDGVLTASFLDVFSSGQLRIAMPIVLFLAGIKLLFV